MGLFDRFKKPKWESEDSKVRLEGVRQLTDSEILINIAINDEDYHVRNAAVEKIRDKPVLVDIAINDECPTVRLTAIEKITDNNVLLDIAKRDSEWCVRNEAVNRIGIQNINDESILSDIAQNASDREVCKVAIGKISDGSLLTDIAQNAVNDEVRQIAQKRIDGGGVRKPFDMDRYVNLDYEIFDGESETNRMMLDLLRTPSKADTTDYAGEFLKMYELGNYEESVVYLITEWDNHPDANCFLANFSVLSSEFASGGAIRDVAMLDELLYRGLNDPVVSNPDLHDAFIGISRQSANDLAASPHLDDAQRQRAKEMINYF